MATQIAQALFENKIAWLGNLSNLMGSRLQWTISGETILTMWPTRTDELLILMLKAICAALFALNKTQLILSLTWNSAAPSGEFLH